MYPKLFLIEGTIMTPFVLAQSQILPDLSFASEVIRHFFRSILSSGET